MIDSAEQTAARLAEDLPRLGLAASGGTRFVGFAVHGPGASGRPCQANRGSLTCLVSDNAERFARIGSMFLGEQIDRVRYVDPEEFFAAGKSAAQAAAQ